MLCARTSYFPQQSDLECFSFRAQEYEETGHQSAPDHQNQLVLAVQVSNHPSCSFLATQADITESSSAGPLTPDGKESPAVPALPDPAATAATAAALAKAAAAANAAAAAAKAAAASRDMAARIAAVK